MPSRRIKKPAPPGRATIPGRPVPPHIQRAIISEIAAGATQAELSRAYGVSTPAVNRIVKGNPIARQSVDNWRDQHRNLAVSAVTTGLSDPEKRYPGAELGVQVLKGLGEYSNDQVNVQLNTFMSNMPRDLQSHFVETPPAIPTNNDGTPE